MGKLQTENQMIRTTTVLKPQVVRFKESQDITVTGQKTGTFIESDLTEIPAQ